MSLAASNRILAILDYFLSHAEGTLGDVADDLGVSVRTVRNDVKHINDLLVDAGSIEADKGNLRLYVYDRAAMDRFIQDIWSQELDTDTPEWRQARIFGILAHADRPLTVEAIANRLYVSVSTCRGDLAQLRNDIASYGMSVIGKENLGVRLDGDEMEVRTYLVSVAFDAVYGDYLLPSKIRKVICRDGREISAEENVRESLTRYVTVMLDRFGHGHTLGTVSDQVARLANSPEFAPINTLMDDLGVATGEVYPQRERLFVLLSIIGTRVPGDVNAMGPIELDEEVSSIAHDILAAVRDDLNIEIAFGDITNEVLMHLKFMLNRLRFGIKLKNPMLEEIRTKYPLEYEMAGIALRIIKEHTLLDASEDERGYLAAYFGVQLERMRKPQDRGLRIAIVANSERITARLIGAQLEKVLDSSDQLSLFTRSEVSANLLGDYDVVLTTTDLPFDCVSPVILVREVFNEREMVERIHQAVTLPQKPAAPVAADALNERPILSSLLDEGHFFLFKDPISYRDSEDLMVQALVERGELDQGFADRLHKREQNHRMIFSHSVAMPHANQTARDGVALALGIYPHPARDGADTVRVTFLLGVSEDHTDGRFLVSLYDEIVSLAQDEQRVVALSRAWDWRQALRILQGGQ